MAELVVSVVGRLRKLEELLPKDEDVFSGDTMQAAFDDLMAALPLLADLTAVVSTAPSIAREGPSGFGQVYDDWLAEARAVLVRLSEQLDQEENG